MLLYGLACPLECQRLSFDVTALTLVTVWTFSVSSFGGLRIANIRLVVFILETCMMMMMIQCNYVHSNSDLKMNQFDIRLLLFLCEADNHFLCTLLFFHLCRILFLKQWKRKYFHDQKEANS